MLENENLLLRLRQGVDEYSRAQQKLGEFVLGGPTKVVYLTITELVRENDANKADVTRLRHVLECKGCNELKMTLAFDLQQGRSVERSEDEIDNVVNESVQALQDTVRLPDRTLLESAALVLHQVQSVRIYGAAASATLREYLHHKLLHLGKPAQLFSDIHRAAMNVTTFNRDMLVVAISGSGSTRNLLHVVKLARKQGVRVLALSNTLRSLLASLNGIQLVAARPEDPLSAGALNAKVGVMLSVEFPTTPPIALNEKYSDVSQQIASAILPLLL